MNSQPEHIQSLINEIDKLVERASTQLRDRPTEGNTQEVIVQNLELLEHLEKLRAYLLARESESSSTATPSTAAPSTGSSAPASSYSPPRSLPPASATATPPLSPPLSSTFPDKSLEQWLGEALQASLQTGSQLPSNVLQNLPPEARSPLPGSLSATPWATPASNPAVNPAVNPAASSSALARDIMLLHSSLLQPLRTELETLRQERERLSQEIHQLQAQSQYQHSLVQQQANQERTISTFVQALQDRLHTTIVQQLGGMLQVLETRLLAYFSSAQARLTLPEAGGTEAIGQPETSALLHPEQRLEQIQRIQSESDRRLLDLDRHLQTSFNTLLANIQSYEIALAQGVEKMHQMGQQGEAILQNLIQRSSQVFADFNEQYTPQILPDTAKTIEQAIPEQETLEQAITEQILEVASLNLVTDSDLDSVPNLDVNQLQESFVSNDDAPSPVAVETIAAEPIIAVVNLDEPSDKNDFDALSASTELMTESVIEGIVEDADDRGDSNLEISTKASEEICEEIESPFGEFPDLETAASPVDLSAILDLVHVSPIGDPVIVDDPSLVSEAEVSAEILTHGTTLSEIIDHEIHTISDEVSEGETGDREAIDHEFLESEIIASKISDGELLESEVIMSEISDDEIITNEAIVSTITDSEVTHGEVANSEVTDSEVANSEVTDSEVTDSKTIALEVLTSEISDSEITFYEITSSEVIEQEITTSEILTGESSESEITNPEITTSEIIDRDLAMSDVLISEEAIALTISHESPDLEIDLEIPAQEIDTGDCIVETPESSSDLSEDLSDNLETLFEQTVSPLSETLEPEDLTKNLSGDLPDNLLENISEESETITVELEPKLDSSFEPEAELTIAELDSDFQADHELTQVAALEDSAANLIDHSDDFTGSIAPEIPESLPPQNLPHESLLSEGQPLEITPDFDLEIDLNSESKSLTTEDFGVDTEEDFESLSIQNLVDAADSNNDAIVKPSPSSSADLDEEIDLEISEDLEILEQTSTEASDLSFEDSKAELFEPELPESNFDLTADLATSIESPVTEIQTGLDSRWLDDSETASSFSHLTSNAGNPMDSDWNTEEEFIADEVLENLANDELEENLATTLDAELDGEPIDFGFDEDADRIGLPISVAPTLATPPRSVEEIAKDLQQSRNVTTESNTALMLNSVGIESGLVAFLDHEADDPEAPELGENLGSSENIDEAIDQSESSADSSANISLPEITEISDDISNEFDELSGDFSTDLNANFDQDVDEDLNEDFSEDLLDEISDQKSLQDIHDDFSSLVSEMIDHPILDDNQDRFTGNIHEAVTKLEIDTPIESSLAVHDFSVSDATTSDLPIQDPFITETLLDLATEQAELSDNSDNFETLDQPNQSLNYDLADHFDDDFEALVAASLTEEETEPITEFTPSETASDLTSDAVSDDMSSDVASIAAMSSEMALEMMGYEANEIYTPIDTSINQPLDDQPEFSEVLDPTFTESITDTFSDEIAEVLEVTTSVEDVDEFDQMAAEQLSETVAEIVTSNAVIVAPLPDPWDTLDDTIDPDLNTDETDQSTDFQSINLVDLDVAGTETTDEAWTDSQDLPEPDLPEAVSLSSDIDTAEDFDPSLFGNNEEFYEPTNEPINAPEHELVNEPEHESISEPINAPESIKVDLFSPLEIQSALDAMDDSVLFGLPVLEETELGAELSIESEVDAELKSVLSSQSEIEQKIEDAAELGIVIEIEVETQSDAVLDLELEPQSDFEENPASNFGLNLNPDIESETLQDFSFEHEFEYEDSQNLGVDNLIQAQEVGVLEDDQLVQNEGDDLLVDVSLTEAVIVEIVESIPQSDNPFIVDIDELVADQVLDETVEPDINLEADLDFEQKLETDFDATTADTITDVKTDVNDEVLTTTDVLGNSHTPVYDYEFEIIEDDLDASELTVPESGIMRTGLQVSSSAPEVAAQDFTYVFETESLPLPEKELTDLGDEPIDAMSVIEMNAIDYHSDLHAIHTSEPSESSILADEDLEEMSPNEADEFADLDAVREVNEAPEFNELIELDELGELEAISELNEVSETDSELGEIDELVEPSELDELSEVAITNEVHEADDFDELIEIDELSAVSELDEVTEPDIELGEIDRTNELSELDEVAATNEVHEADDFDELIEIDDFSAVSELDEVSETDSELGEIDELIEPSELDELSEVAITNEVHEADDFDELIEVDDFSAVSELNEVTEPDIELGEIDRTNELSELDEVATTNEVHEADDFDELIEIDDFSAVSELDEVSETDSELGEIDELVELSELDEVAMTNEVHQANDFNELIKLDEADELGEITVISEIDEANEIADFSITNEFDKADEIVEPSPIATPQPQPSSDRSGLLDDLNSNAITPTPRLEEHEFFNTPTSSNLTPTSDQNDRISAQLAADFENSIENTVTPPFESSIDNSFESFESLVTDVTQTDFPKTTEIVQNKDSDTHSLETNPAPDSAIGSSMPPSSAPDPDSLLPSIDASTPRSNSNDAAEQIANDLLGELTAESRPFRAAESMAEAFSLFDPASETIAPTKPPTQRNAAEELDLELLSSSTEPPRKLDTINLDLTTSTPSSSSSANISQRSTTQPPSTSRSHPAPTPAPTMANPNVTGSSGTSGSNRQAGSGEMGNGETGNGATGDSVTGDSATGDSATGDGTTSDGGSGEDGSGGVSPLSRGEPPPERIPDVITAPDPKAQGAEVSNSPTSAPKARPMTAKSAGRSATRSATRSTHPQASPATRQAQPSKRLDVQASVKPTDQAQKPQRQPQSNQTKKTSPAVTTSKATSDQTRSPGVSSIGKSAQSSQKLGQKSGQKSSKSIRGKADQAQQLQQALPLQLKRRRAIEPPSTQATPTPRSTSASQAHASFPATSPDLNSSTATENEDAIDLTIKVIETIDSTVQATHATAPDTPDTTPDNLDTFSPAIEATIAQLATQLQPDLIFREAEEEAATLSQAAIEPGSEALTTDATQAFSDRWQGVEGFDNFDDSVDQRDQRDQRSENDEAFEARLFNTLIDLIQDEDEPETPERSSANAAVEADEVDLDTLDRELEAEIAAAVASFAALEQAAEGATEWAAPTIESDIEPNFELNLGTWHDLDDRAADRLPDKIPDEFASADPTPTPTAWRVDQPADRQKNSALQENALEDRPTTPDPAQLFANLWEMPPPQAMPQDAPNDRWYLGLAITESHLAATLWDRHTDQRYPLQWSLTAAPNSQTLTALLPCCAYIPPDSQTPEDWLVGFAAAAASAHSSQTETEMEATSELSVQPTSPSSTRGEAGIVLENFLSCFAIGIPWIDDQHGSQPLITWTRSPISTPIAPTVTPSATHTDLILDAIATDSHPGESLSLYELRYALRSLLVCLRDTAQLGMPIEPIAPFSKMLNEPESQTDQNPDRQTLPELAGIVVNQPWAANAAYRFNLREAIVEAGLVFEPGQIWFADEAIAAVTPPNLAHAGTEPSPHAAGYTLALYSGDRAIEVLLGERGARTTDAQPPAISPLEQAQESDHLRCHFAYGYGDLEQDIICQILLSEAVLSSIAPHSFAADFAQSLAPLLANLERPRPGQPDRAARICLQQALQSVAMGRTLGTIARSLYQTLQQQSTFQLNSRLSEKLSGSQQTVTITRSQLEQAVIQPLLAQLQQTFNHHLSRIGIPIQQITHLILAGELAQDPSIRQWLRQKLPNARFINAQGQAQSLAIGSTATPAIAPAPLAATRSPIAMTQLAEGLTYWARSIVTGHSKIPDRQQYDHYFLLHELLRLIPQSPCTLAELTVNLEQVGIPQAILTEFLPAILANQLPDGLLPALPSAIWLDTDSRSHPVYQILQTATYFDALPASAAFSTPSAVAPIGARPTRSLTKFQPKFQHLTWLRHYLYCLTLGSVQTFQEPMTSVMTRVTPSP